MEGAVMEGGAFGFVRRVFKEALSQKKKKKGAERVAEKWRI